MRSAWCRAAHPGAQEPDYARGLIVGSRTSLLKDVEREARAQTRKEWGEQAALQADTPQGLGNMPFGRRQR